MSMHTGPAWKPCGAVSQAASDSTMLTVRIGCFQLEPAVAADFAAWCTPFQSLLVFSRLKWLGRHYWWHGYEFFSSVFTAAACLQS